MPSARAKTRRPTSAEGAIFMRRRMKLQSIVYGVMGLALASAVTVAAQVDLAKTAKLRNPAALTEQAPGDYKVTFDTSRGRFVVQVHRDWAPLAADRFYNLVANGFYDDV